MIRLDKRRRGVVFHKLALPILMVLPVAPGCGVSGRPPSDARVAIENVAKWRQLYLANHGRKPPDDETELLNFIEKKMKDRGETFDRETFLVSPRDGLKYVIQYGKESANLGENSVAVYEKEGFGGKVLVAFVSARSSEVDAAELASLLATRP
jgi:hypothetical protein